MTQHDELFASSTHNCTQVCAGAVLQCAGGMQPHGNHAQLATSCAVHTLMTLVCTRLTCGPDANPNLV
jgi:hypothetical protein